ncbi:unnamed protein product [Trichobilharzia regenti]|nr:unnamed protein product [Trichobilharzia regenti]
MIRAILVINNHGKPRLIKFYEHYSEDEQQKIVKEVFNLVSRRDDDVCNFLEGGTLVGGQDYRLIYLFVEALDKCFENVCELDLIFHVDKVSSVFHHSVVWNRFSSFICEEMTYRALWQISQQGVSATLKELVSFHPTDSCYLGVLVGLTYLNNPTSYTGWNQCSCRSYHTRKVVRIAIRLKAVTSLV